MFLLLFLAKRSFNLTFRYIDEVLSLNNYGLGDLVYPIELEIKGTYKVRNEIETKRNETKSTKTKRNETKRNETKSTKTKRNETKSTK